MMKENNDQPLSARGNGWVSCGIGSGAGKASIWRCESCAWEAEISAWKPKTCPRCGHPFKLETQA